MYRFSTLGVERLEDRCVPTADLTDAATATLVAEPTTSETVVVEVVEETTTVEDTTVNYTAVEDGTATEGTGETTDSGETDDTSFVIDVYLNDPTTDPEPLDKPPEEEPIGGSEEPTEPVPPPDDPFWY